MTPHVLSEGGCAVQLRYAPLPYIFGAMADHSWPGPNSNTFAAWVLREAGIEYPLHWKAIGSHYGKT